MPGKDTTMKAVFDRDELLTALIPASGIVPGRNTSANIDGILFECPGEEPGSCRLSVYDLEKGMRTVIGANIMSEGKYILNTQKVLQIVRSFPAGEVMISVDNSMKATISAGNGTFEISALPGDDFPHLPLLTGDRNYVMPQHEFRAMISQTVYAAAQNDPRPACNGVYFKIEGGKMTVVACDGNRIAINEAPSPEDYPDAAFLVPSKILLELMKLIKDSEDEITVSLARKHVIFKIGEGNYFARLIDAEYINYQRIIPTEFKTEAFIEKDAFRSALERAMLITEDKLGGNYRTFVRLDFEGDLLKISSASTSGSVYEEIPCAKNGDDLTIAFNCRYMVEALRAMPEDVYTVRLRMNSAVVGVRIEEARGSGIAEDVDSPVPDGCRVSDNGDKFRFIYFVMPVKMNK